MTTEQTYLAIDIESAGSGLDHAVLAIGAVLGDTKGNVIEKKRWCLPVPDYSGFEERCWEEFWNTPDNLKILKKIKSESDKMAFSNFCGLAAWIGEEI